ncbi:MAG: hypothetical protein ACK5ML_14360 [Lachnospiraceae bacterium]
MGRLWNMIFGWEEVLATSNIDQYMKMKIELDNKGIESQTKFVNNPGSHRGVGTMNNVGMYYLYIKKAKN